MSDVSRLPVIGFHRVELIVAENQIEGAVRQFNEVFGLQLPTPHPIETAPVLSSTDFDGGLELVAPVGGQGFFGVKLAEHGPGQIGPLVWEVDDIDASRVWLAEHGYRIVHEYDSRTGNESEAGVPVQQLVLDPSQWYGFNVTLMKRHDRTALRDDRAVNKAVARAFCEHYSNAAWGELAGLLHEEFRWIAPTSQRRQSAVLADVPTLNESPGLTKAETLATFRAVRDRVADGRFDMRPVSFTAEDDRVAMEAESYAVNAANGRVYDNRYHISIVFRDGLIVEFREYQDTLLVFDVWMAP